jgi:hypothetical protein
LRGQLYLRPQLLLEARRALLRTANPKHKLILVDEAVGESVNQMGYGLLQLGDLRFYRIQVRINLGRSQAPPVLVLESVRVFKQSADLSPDGRLEQVASDLVICAYPPTAESISVSAGAAVVNMRRSAARPAPARESARIGPRHRTLANSCSDIRKERMTSH